MDILLTAFRDTSAELLLKAHNGYNTLFLPNDKVKDSEITINALKKESANYVICFGQKPLIRNKITVETTAGDGEIRLKTAFDCERIRALFEEKGIDAKISHNAGTSFCSRLYYNILNYIAQITPRHARYSFISRSQKTLTIPGALRIRFSALFGFIAITQPSIEKNTTN